MNQKSRSIRAAVNALLGINPITGHLLVNLPPFHERGAGITREGSIK